MFSVHFNNAKRIHETEVYIDIRTVSTYFLPISLRWKSIIFNYVKASQVVQSKLKNVDRGDVENSACELKEIFHHLIFESRFLRSVCVIIFLLSRLRICLQASHVNLYWSANYFWWSFTSFLVKLIYWTH